MPPPGGEGYTGLQSGAALAEGASAAYYNPAALAELNRSTGSTVGAAYSAQDILPILRLPDLNQEFHAAYLVFADPEGGTDLGVGIFRNHINFGKNYPSDPDAKPFDSDETVWGLATGVRLGFWLSLGLGAKFIDSRLAQGTAGPVSDGIARSWAFDIGILAMPRLRAPAAWNLPLTFVPSAAVTVTNIGPDVFYIDAIQSDPIPRTYTGAAALSAEAWGLVSATGHWQVEQEWTRRSEKLSPVYNAGVMGRLFLFEFGEALLVDHAGQRREWHSSQAFVFDAGAWARMKAGLRSGNWGDLAGSGRGFGYWKPFGEKVALRPRFGFGRHIIHSEDEGIRNGQEAWYLTLSL